MGVASIIFESTFNRTAISFFNPANISFLFLAAYIGFLVNTILTAIAISLSENKNFINIWIYNYAWLIPFIFFLAVMAIFISFLYKLYGPPTVIFTSLPLIIAQYAYMLRIKERKALINSIMQIVKIIDAKDPYTAGHSIRVAEYTEKIARKLRLNEYDVDILTNLANLHDIGKVQIDLSILNKPGKYDDANWVEMKKHPEVGYEIVKEIVFLKNYAKAILYHHEKIDGSGYPHGIKGDKIPLFAKILTVADAYDAMTSNRPYKKALTQKKAIKELERCADKDFDRKISGIMIEIIKEENPLEC
jgi:putative nucleotidyltransferase with HDIG domain